ncbi:MAG: type II toxin-antitoxin system VapC family toxin [Chloroflexota bacterium]|nr:type II toxin-antitoxin system VapC family toxin [Chloroflexota bacterium]MDE2884053.1 type II toxin-antitoxin system VapC family toxin [Chloroflexota bacterium]
MSGYLLDTNVISELAKSPPDRHVVTFLNTMDDLWIPVIALYEIEYGLQLLPQGRRRNSIAVAMTGFLDEYSQRTLSMDREAAKYAGGLRAEAHRSGRRLRIADALIAGIAAANDLSLATRNVADFDYLPIEVANPWLGV